MRIHLLSQIFLAFFIYLIVVNLYTGLVSLPTEGDSLAYHIPIARSIINGKVVDPSQFSASPFLKYSPGAAELLLSPLIILGVPINIYNVFGVAVLFFVGIFAGRRFGMSRDFSIIFAVSISSLNGIVRWMNTQIIDIWLLVFFLFSIGLLEKPEKSLKYFLKLGFVMGMLCGSKFTGPILAILLLVFYFRKLLNVINFERISVFIVPFFLFGAIWYLRNFLLTGNPLYPQPFLYFKGGGEQFTILNISVLKVLTNYPKGFFMTMNAYIAEYTIWTLSFFISVYFVLRKTFDKTIKKNGQVLRIFLIGLCSLVLFLFLPSAFQEHITVSVMRYSYPAFILFILCVFLIAKKYKKEELIAIISIANIFIMEFPLGYYPKLVFLYIPLTLFVIYWDQIKKKIYSSSE